MHWMLMPIRRYANFRGRSRRKEYWMFALFNVLLGLGFGVVQAVIGYSIASVLTQSAMGAQDINSGAATVGPAALGVVGIVQVLISLALIIPGLAVSVRRLHDIDRTGWWLAAPIALYAVIIGAVVYGIGSMLGASANLDPTSGAGPHVAALAIAGIAGIALLVLGITLFVFACLAGTRGPNRYGPDPKGSGEALDEVFR